MKPISPKMKGSFVISCPRIDMPRCKSRESRILIACCRKENKFFWVLIQFLGRTFYATRSFVSTQSLTEGLDCIHMVSILTWYRGSTILSLVLRLTHSCNPRTWPAFLPGISECTIPFPAVIHWTSPVSRIPAAPVKSSCWNLPRPQTTPLSQKHQWFGRLF